MVFSDGFHCILVVYQMLMLQEPYHYMYANLVRLWSEKTPVRKYHMGLYEIVCLK